MIISDQIALSSTAATKILSGPRGQAALGAATVTLQNASATCYVGGSNVSSSNGYPLQNGTAPTTGVVQPLATVTIAPVVGDVYAIGAAAGLTVTVLYSFSENA